MNEQNNYLSPEQLPMTIRVEEVAKILRVSRNTAYALVRSGSLPSFKVGRQLRIAKRHLLAFMESDAVR